ncbi:hypothetical protein LB553_00825 [Mesorhizobium sp. CA8]|uniref:hypothetical protein n=1 Tax=Mesorhizobium sp. CA8 TaxID=2876637 RepID=UPI001CCB10CB|nr:hypothetical protein [Mesorhizobium sp. CA8]MBZ9759430.1 hypothetical protein [Mesorhizobium sp. CA8]
MTDPADIERIERGMREALESVGNLHWGTRGIFNLSSATTSAIDAFTDLCSPENISAILDELSRLREENRMLATEAHSYLSQLLQPDDSAARAFMERKGDAG